jgi:hypothetical protein
MGFIQDNDAGVARASDDLFNGIVWSGRRQVRCPTGVGGRARLGTGQHGWVEFIGEHWADLFPHLERVFVTHFAVRAEGCGGQGVTGLEIAPLSQSGICHIGSGRLRWTLRAEEQWGQGYKNEPLSYHYPLPTSAIETDDVARPVKRVREYRGGKAQPKP